MMITALVVVVMAVVAVARQMGEMGGDFFLQSLLDVVSINVKMLVTLFDVDLDRRRRVAQVCPRMSRMSRVPRMCRMCN